MHSFVSPNLSLILLVGFSFQLLYLASDWFLFIFSSTLLNSSLCPSILFPSSVSILITNNLNSFSGKLSVSLVVLSGFFSLVHSLEIKTSVLFCLTCYVCMKLGETVNHYSLEVLKRCSWMRASYVLCLCPLALMLDLDLKGARAVLCPRV